MDEILSKARQVLIERPELMRLANLINAAAKQAPSKENILWYLIAGGFLPPGNFHYFATDKTCGIQLDSDGHPKLLRISVRRRESNLLTPFFYKDNLA